MLGTDTKLPGVVMPGKPKVGTKFKCEDVSKTINESDEVAAVGETVTVPAGISGAIRWTRPTRCTG